MQAANARKQGIYSQKVSKKADFKKENPFLSRIFLETEQEVFGYAKHMQEGLQQYHLMDDEHPPGYP